MKTTLYIALFLLASFSSFAQTDSSKIEQYCQVIATPRLLSNKVTIDIDFGEEKSFWRDTRLKTYDGRFKKFNTIIDALNFMGNEGWVFINAYPVRDNQTEIYHSRLKRYLQDQKLKIANRLPVASTNTLNSSDFFIP